MSFTISTYNGENKFGIVTDYVGSGNFKIVGRKDYLGAIWRSIRTLKERTSYTCHTLPNNIYTKLMIQKMVMRVPNMLNMFPNKDGIDQDLSPDAILLGTPNIDYNNYN